MEEFHHDLESDTEQALRKSVKRRMKIGGVLCVLLPFGPVMIFFLQNLLPQAATTLLLILFLSIGFIGFLMFGYYRLGSSMLFRGIDVLRQIAPPESFVKGKLAVLNKDPVYVIIQWGSNALLFVAFFQSERSFDKGVALPRVIWKWEYSHPIGEIKVARREGSFTIPVDRDTYYTGRGILYSLLLEETVIVTMHKSYTAEELNQIVDALAQEVVSYGSGHYLGDDEF
ncbi:MAG: hypothetical protein ThorAB25_22030 [Candidatus Thorarchaeota archaeon AB_25]|nr:MAG: hypothetical protein ThorAB25_22030 [Candidatus Thorarchaeota archaeon AB_25]